MIIIIIIIDNIRSPYFLNVPSRGLHRCAHDDGLTHINTSNEVRIAVLLSQLTKKKIPLFFRANFLSYRSVYFTALTNFMEQRPS